MSLWTDLIDPATLTGYARASLEDYEQRKGTLAQFLPNREVPDIIARFVAGSNGLVNVASFRAYDAEQTIGKRQPGKRVTLELPALGQNIPVTEYEQLRLRGNVSDESALRSIQNTTDQVVASVADSLERMRGVVLSTGVATIDDGDFHSADDFGRDSSHSVNAGTAWDATGADPLGDLEDWSDTYRDDNGENAGALVMSTRVMRVLANNPSFATQLVNGGSRPATQQQVNDLVQAAGLPPIILYDRRVQVAGAATKVLPNDSVFLLPGPVSTDDWQGTQLGATFWGRTLTSTDANWSIEDAEQPGLVAGVYRNEKPPMGIEVISDAIGLPVLANANLSFVAKVLDLV